MRSAHLRKLLGNMALHFNLSLDRFFAFSVGVLLRWVLIVDEAFSLKKVFLAALLAPTFRSILAWRAARCLVRVVLDVDLVVLLKVLLVFVWFYVLLESCN